MVADTPSKTCRCTDPDSDDSCPECCEHWDMDEGYCLDCGKDRREDLMASAYDYWKDRQKYGDD